MPLGAGFSLSEPTLPPPLPKGAGAEQDDPKGHGFALLLRATCLRRGTLRRVAQAQTIQQPIRPLGSAPFQVVWKIAVPAMPGRLVPSWPHSTPVLPSQVLGGCFEVCMKSDLSLVAVITRCAQHPVLMG